MKRIVIGIVDDNNIDKRKEGAQSGNGVGKCNCIQRFFIASSLFLFDQFIYCRFNECHCFCLPDDFINLWRIKYLQFVLIVGFSSLADS